MPIKIDISNHLAQRRAVGAVLDRIRERRRVHVLGSSFGAKGTTHEVRVGNRYFRVDTPHLHQLQAGADPDDLWGIDEIEPEEED